MYYFMCVMLTSDVNCLFTPRSEENNGKKTEIIDQPRFHADTHSTSQKCPLISSLTPLFDSTNYLALFRSYQRAIIHCQTFSVARGERNAHFSVLAPRLFRCRAVICTAFPAWKVLLLAMFFNLATTQMIRLMSLNLSSFCSANLRPQFSTGWYRTWGPFHQRDSLFN